MLEAYVGSKPLSPSDVEATVIRVGLCGFTMAMEDYPLLFPVVEVQQTFYEPPRDTVMQRWIAATPAGFEFTIKAWQLVTHPGKSPTYRRTKRPLTDVEKRTAGFFQPTKIVEEGYARSLACARLLSATAILFQCPASFAPDATNIARLRRFFTRIERPAGVRLLWEPRGPKWAAEREHAGALCEELDLVHVVDPFVTKPLDGPIYWRLHGITGARHVYTDTELRRLRAMIDEVAPTTDAYVMFNNIPRVADAKRFRRLL